MTDEKKTKRDEDELVLDWDDAEDSWGQDSKSFPRAEAAPFSSPIDSAPVRSQADSTEPPAGAAGPTGRPGGEANMASLLPKPTANKQAAKPAADAPRAKPMYQPPSAAEIRALQNQNDRPTPPPPSHSQYDDFEDSGDDTRIATIPRELIESLSRLETTDRELNVRSIITVVPNRDSEQLSISIDEGEYDPDLGPRDTDPTGLDLGQEGSGVFSPPQARPSKPSLEPEPYRHRQQTERENIGSEDDNTRVLDLTEVDFSASPVSGMAANGPRNTSVPPPTPTTKRTSERDEVSVLRNLEELSPPMRETPVIEKPAPSLPPSEDRGAAAALRTVRARKPRSENLPLVGGDEPARRARAAMLQALAKKRTGRTEAQLLTQAAALHEEVGDTTAGRALYEEALAADPSMAEARRGQARLVLHAGDKERYVALLEEQLKLALTPGTRAQVLFALALCRWLVQNDLASALQAATEAARLLPDDVACAALLARLELSANPAQVDAAATNLARLVRDDSLAAVLHVAAGRALLERGEHESALSQLSAAFARDPEAVEAQLTTTRALIALGRPAEAVVPLSRAASAIGGAPGTALHRQAARLLAIDENRLETGARLLLDADDGISLRTAFQYARRAQAEDLKAEIVAAWTRASHGRDRALSLLTLAELCSSKGESDACEEALQAAGRADPQLALVPVVREVLARSRGDSAKLAEMSAAEGDSALGSVSAAAKLARTASTRGQELGWLERARQAGAEPICIDAVLIDASAELQATDLLRSALRDTMERSSVDARVSSALALADVERRHDNASAANELTAEAAGLDPRSMLAARSLLRHTEDREVQANLWRKEAEATRGTRAAFAHLRAGHATVDDADARLAAFAAAHDAAPTYTPAAWAVHQEARDQGDLARLAELHGREAGRAKDPLDAVAHLVRAALIRANEDADGAAAQLARALDLTPTDPVLRELVLRLGDAVPATLRAEAMQRTAENAPASLRRAALLAAAGAFEDAHQPERAADLYTSVLSTHPDDPIAEMGYERVAPMAGKLEELLAHFRTTAESAGTPAARVKALEELIALDTEAEPALLTTRAHAILDLDPHHALSLRQLERVAMQENDVASLAQIEARMLEMSKGPIDKASRLRIIAFAHAQGESDANSTDLDRLLLGPGLDAASNPWVARQLMGAAVANRDPQGSERAAELLIEACSEPIELASAAIVRARDQHSEAPDEALRQLEEALAQFPEHPIAAEALAEARMRARDLRGAAEGFEAAAKSSLSRSRAARLWYRAGRLWQEDLRSPDRARDAFGCAAESDITYADVQTRLASLLSGRNDLAGLISLTEARLRSGGPPDQIAEVHRSLAKLHEKKSDRTSARTSLRAALSVAPEHLATLRDFAELCERDQDWRECAEALIRLARLSRDAAELREVFFKLGEVYDLHLPDARRAEAAYRRVLKLGPKHSKALERLAALYQREGQHELAIEALERLTQVADTGARKREVTFELARLKEAHGDPRGAEEALEQLRKDAPIDLYVLRGLADFYRRQHATSALAMHLNRAANDLRAVIADDLDDAALWSALVEMLEQRGRKDAAGACASAAFALGLADANVVAYTDKEGGTPGVGGAAFSELLDDLLYPELMNPAVRVVFRYAAEALNKAAPFDLKLLGGEKLDRKHPLRGTSQEVARWMSVPEVEIYVTDHLPYAFVPIQDAPVALLVGRTLLDNLTRGEAQFLVARALKMARAQMSLCCRVRPEEVGMMLHALIRAHAPEYTPARIDLALLDEWGKRISKYLSRKTREELLPHLIELETADNFEPTRVYEMASTAASRAGLLATGSVPSAATALCKMAGMPSSTRHNAMSMSQVAETRDLLLFAISEAHFEARQRAGVDRR